MAVAALALAGCGGGETETAGRFVDFDTVDVDPDWSPDGRLIAFATNRGSGGIYLIRPDGTGMRRVFAGEATDVDWSPDGKSIAFTGARGLYVLRLADRKASLIPKSAGLSRAAWARDGRQLAVVKDERDRFRTYDGKPFSASYSAIFVIRTNGGGLRRLLPRYRGAIGDARPDSIAARSETDPAWSPDGKRIAFEAGDGQITVAQVKTGRRVAVVNGGYGYEAAWSPDGRLIAYQCEGDVCVANADGSGGGRMVASDGGDPSWSPDSQRIVFEHYLYGGYSYGSHPRSLSIVDADGGGLKTLTFGPAHPAGRKKEVASTTKQAPTAKPRGPQSTRVGFAPAWSFDGRTVAFIEFAGRGASRLAFVNIDGTGLRRISGAFPGIEEVAWSPRRPELLVRTTDGGLPGYEHGDIQLLRTTGEMVNLTRSPSINEEDMAWSPDGAQIAFTGRDGAVYAMRRDGTGVRKLTRPPAESAGDSSPAWSPDGRVIAFRRSAEKESVFIVDLRRVKERRLATIRPSGDNTNLASWSVVWTRDGTAIVTDIFARISVVDATTGRTRTFPLYAGGARPGPGHIVLADTYVAPKCSLCPPTRSGPTVLFDLSTGKARNLLPKPLPKGVTAQYAIDYAWSPDGKHIAAVLVTGPDSSTRALFVVDPSDGSMRRIAG